MLKEVIRKMAASSRAPIEVWSQILYSTFEYYLGYEWSPNLQSAWPESRVEEYWTSEKQRCILRLVCKTWKECVDKKQHRLLQMWDFLYHKMGDEIMLKAERVIFNLPNYCGCWKCKGCRNKDRGVWLDGAINPFTHLGGHGPWGLHQVRWAHLHTKKFIQVFLKLQACHPRDLQGQAVHIAQVFNIEDLTDTPPMIHPSVVSLEISVATSVFEINQISTIFPRLVHLGLFQSNVKGSSPNSPTSVIQFPHLESFSTLLDTRDLISYGFSSWKLPQLKHLQLSAPRYSLKQFIDLLGPHSESLKFLYFWFSGPIQFPMDTYRWDFLPKLESTNWLPFSEDILCVPDETHPLSTVVYVPVFVPNDRDIQDESQNRPFGAKDRESLDILFQNRSLVLKFMLSWEAFCTEGNHPNANAATRQAWYESIYKWSQNGIKIVDINDKPWVQEIRLELCRVWSIDLLE